MTTDNFPLKVLRNYVIIIMRCHPLIPGGYTATSSTLTLVRHISDELKESAFLLGLHVGPPSCWRRSVDVSQHQVEVAAHPVAAVTRLLQAEPDQAGQQSHGRGQQEAEQPGGGAPAAGGPTGRTSTRRRTRVQFLKKS